MDRDPAGRTTVLYSANPAASRGGTWRIRLARKVTACYHRV
jgi:hypothetical protein